MSDTRTDCPCAELDTDKLHRDVGSLWEQWCAGDDGAREQLLARAVELEPQRLVQLAIVQQQREWCQGNNIRAETWFERYPVLASDRECAVDLVYAEYLLDSAAGSGNADEYLTRFPELRDVLRRQFDLDHDFLAEPPEVKAQPDSIGTIGEYELLEVIARGGMGIVYKARQRGLDRLVALKMIKAGRFADQTAIQRFYVEAKAAAELQHRSIVTVYEVGAVAGEHYYSMEYVSGSSLAELIREQPLSPHRAATYVRAIANAMQYAHERGILHRDLKPSNVLLDEQGEPRITDFGLARLIEDESHLTGSLEVLGTPGYMSPEQAAGRGEPVGPQSDVYSLGATLYDLLTGRPPFRAANAFDTRQQVLDTAPASPRLINRKVPRDLETICLKCLEKDPGRRYASAAALADELERFLDDQPIHSPRISRLTRLAEWARRNPRFADLTTMIALLLLVAVAVGSLSVPDLFQQTAKDMGHGRLLHSETLEVSALLATVGWDGGGGSDTSWGTAANWEDDQLPLPTDDVSFDAGDVAVIDGDFSIRSFNMSDGSVAFAPGENTLSVSGNWTVSGGSFDPADGTVSFEAGAWNVDPGDVPFNDVIVDCPSGVFTALAPITINGSLDLQAVNQMWGEDINVAGDLNIARVNSMFGRIAVTGNVTTSARDVSGNSYLGGSGPILLNGTNDQSVTVVGGDTGGIPGIVVEKPSGNVTFGPVGSTLTNAQDWRIVTADSVDLQNTVKFVGGAWNVDPGDVPFNDVIVDCPSGVFTALAPITINGSLDLQAVNQMWGEDINVAGDLNIARVNSMFGRIAVTGNVTTSARDVSGNSYLGGSGPILLNGTNDQFVTVVGGDTGGIPGIVVEKPSGNVTFGPVGSTLTNAQDWRIVTADSVDLQNTVKFVGGAWNVDPGDVPFNDVIVDCPSGVFTALAPITINGSLDLQAVNQMWGEDINVAGDLNIARVNSIFGRIARTGKLGGQPRRPGWSAE